MLYNGMTLSGSGGPDFSGMSTDEMLAWIRSNYGNVGPVSSIEDANGGVSGYSARDGMQMTPNGDGTFSGRITGAYDGGGDGGQYGSWTGKFDAQGNLIGDAEWGKNDRSGSWLDQNGWMIPLAVAGWAASPYAMAGAGAAEGAGAAGAGGISIESMTPELIGSSMETSGGLLGTQALTAGGIPASAIPTFSALTPEMAAITAGMTPEALATLGTAAASAGGASVFSQLIDAIGGPKTAAQLAGAALGAAASGRTQGGTQTASKEPWSAAQPWLRGLLDQGAALQDYYQRNPTNAIQDTARQNYLSGVDNFNQNTAPGLMNWANSWMNGSNTYRPTGGNGLLDRLFTGQQPGASTPPMTQVRAASAEPPAGPFSSGTYAPIGTVNWNSMNPFRNGVNSLLNYMPRTSTGG